MPKKLCVCAPLDPHTQREDVSQLLFKLVAIRHPKKN